MRPRRLLVDCTDSYLRPEYATGIQRVTRELAARCGSQSPGGWQSLPVYHLHGMWCVARDGLFNDALKLTRVWRKAVHGLFRRFREKSGLRRWVLSPIWVPLRLAELVLTLAIQVIRTLVHLRNLTGILMPGPGDVLMHPEYPLGHISALDSARARGARVVTVIHDVFQITHPHLFQVDRKLLAWFQWVGRRADSIICVSAFTASEVRRVLGPQRAPVTFFHLGGDFRGTPGPSLEPHADSPPCFLMVGTLEPRKRHSDVLDAFELLWADGFGGRLVFVGRPGWMTEELVQRIVCHPENGNRLVWHDDAPDAFLAKAYQRAHAVIVASEVEGFGLPVVEALSRGTPVIASDIEVFREVAGSFADFFPMGDVVALAEAVRRAALKRRKDVTGFSWPSWDQASRNAQQLAVADFGAESPADLNS